MVDNDGGYLWLLSEGEKAYGDYVITAVVSTFGCGLPNVRRVLLGAQ